MDVIDRQKVIDALENKRTHFRDFWIEQEQQRRALDDRLARFQHYDYASMSAQLDAIGELWCGARPTPEWDRADGLLLPFEHEWSDHRAARAWALEILRDRPVAAVDGSQITPLKDYSVPIGAVQIGWFINEHRAGGSYTKDIEFDVLAPQDLLDDFVDESEFGFSNWRVNQERFVRECQKLCELMESFATRPASTRPVCFFDGSFIVSFAGQLRPARAQPYLAAVEQLLYCSEQHRVPLVGFIDNPHSRDLLTLMQILLGHSQNGSGIGVDTDAGMLAQLLPQTHWGARSAAFICARRDTLTLERRAATQGSRAQFYQNVIFCYVRVTRDRPPVRIEMPRWLLAADRIDEIIDIVRAQCIVGTGYPYAVETADALAVISQADRQRFYAIFEQFAESAELPFTQATKAASKQRRR